MNEDKPISEKKWVAIAAIATLLGGIFGALIGGWFGRSSGLETTKLIIEATQTAEAQINALKNNEELPNTVPIETFPLVVYQYQCIDECEKATASWFNLTMDGDHNTDYNFSFTIPDSGDGWAGLSFDLVDYLDLTSYEYIELIISFGCEEMIGNVYIKDDSGNDYKYPIGLGIEYKDGTITERIADSIKIKSPVENYESINLKYIDEIVLDFNADDIRGHHYLTIHDINLIRKSGE